MSETKDYIQDIDGAERRFFSAPVTISKRAEGEEGETEFRQIEGIAAMIGKRTNLGWFDEVIERGAFDDVLDNDVRALFNHDPNLILGRTKANTCELYLTNEGHLGFRYTTPNRSYARDLQDAITAGDVDQCSFAFGIKEVAWEYSDNPNENDLRKIVKLERLYDVSPVTYPAYEDTTLALRSYKGTKGPQQERQKEGKPAARSLSLTQKQIEILKLKK